MRFIFLVFVLLLFAFFHSSSRGNEKFEGYSTYIAKSDSGKIDQGKLKQTLEEVKKHLKKNKYYLQDYKVSESDITYSFPEKLDPGSNEFSISVLWRGKAIAFFVIDSNYKISEITVLTD